MPYCTVNERLIIHCDDRSIYCRISYEDCNLAPLDGNLEALDTPPTDKLCQLAPFLDCSREYKLRIREKGKPCLYIAAQ
jgi:hypothetical protein